MLTRRKALAGASILPVVGKAAAQCRVIAPGPAVPAQAAAAGFHTNVLNDDFTTTTTVAPNAAPTGGYNWYWDATGITSASQYNVNTAFIPGTTDGAPTASGASTGVLTISGTQNTFSSGLKSTFQTQVGANKAGSWNHGYFEAYLQFNRIVQGSGGPSGGWPAFWLWAVEALSPVSGQITAECDIMEYFPAGTAGATGTFISTMHNWANTNFAAAGTDDFNTNGSNVPGTQPSNSGWHTYGCLWQGNGTTGTVQFYIDNVLQTMSGTTTTFTLTAANTSPTAGLSAMEADHMSIILGSSNGWPINIDWVRVWQAP